MAKDIKNACKYYTYDVESESNFFNVSWTIMDYSKLLLDKEYKIILNRPNLCYLDLIFEKTKAYGNLHVRNNNTGIITSDITTTIYNEDAKELFRSNKTGVSISDGKTEFTYYILKSLHLDSKSLPNDTLTIDLEFRIKQVETWETFEIKDLNKTGKNLSNDLNRFILKNHPTMVVLKTKEAQIEANKAILCARSSVFEKMFDNPMSEEEKNIVLIDDMTGATVKILVDFLNTDEAPELSKTEYSSLNVVYYAADKYDVQDLRNMCAAHILRGLTIENVCKALELALKHSDDHMKKGCMIFIRRNIAPFIKSEGWKNLKISNPDLGNDIFEFYVTGDSNSK